MELRHCSMLSCACLGALLGLCAEPPAFSDPPPIPGRETWTFREDLAKPEPPARFASAATEKRGDFWVRNRISRCYFGPIKRPPFNHDELMDDIDYYPDAYLERLQREGVNGLWLTVEWRDLAKTSFTQRSPDAERRFAKLRRTVDKCLRYGIKTWIFCIEPCSAADDDPLYRAHPEMYGCEWWGQHVLCPLHPAVQQYVEESVKDIFSHVPRLGGMMMISHGEHATTCFSAVHPVSGLFLRECPRCSKAEPWQMHEKVAAAVMRGIRAAGSKGEYISWLYQPHAQPGRAPWVAEVARHLPEGVTLAYNFESGAVRDQLGKPRVGGDYWLSYVGPADGFRQVADAARESGARLGAKIQVGCSHECATVPFVPVPGLLYRKYKAMREMGVSTVLQCWYFGNYPGLMNAAAGMLSRDDFSEDEQTFLERLAAAHWGPDAKLLADIWRRFSDAYAEYPLSNAMQYYGPFHAGVAWPLIPDIRLLPLARTWLPQDPPSGDLIGECLKGHTIDEAVELAGRMARGMKILDKGGRDVLDVLSDRWKNDPERIRDIGVMKALALQFESGYDIFSFYRDRATAVCESRIHGNAAAAIAALRKMDAVVSSEESVTRRLLPLAKADSRLGFHSEAEAHQYHPVKLEWRLGELARSHARIAEIIGLLEKGGTYPLSEREQTAPSCPVDGDWTEGKDGLRFRIRAQSDGGLAIDFKASAPIALRVFTFDAAGVSHYRLSQVRLDGRRVSTLTLAADSWDSRDERRPEWMQILQDPEGNRKIGEFNLLWPQMPHPDKDKNWWLVHSPANASACGRIVWRKQ